jgi:hypothetical protein
MHSTNLRPVGWLKYTLLTNVKVGTLNAAG